MRYRQCFQIVVHNNETGLKKHDGTLTLNASVLFSSVDFSLLFCLLKLCRYFCQFQEISLIIVGFSFNGKVPTILSITVLAMSICHTCVNFAHQKRIFLVQRTLDC